MEYVATAFIFALLTGYVSVRYEGKIISRLAVLMLLSAAGASLFSSLQIFPQDAIEGAVKIDPNDATSFLSVLALVVGHIGSEFLMGKFLRKTNREESSLSEINDTSDLLQHLSKNKNLKLETEFTVKIK